METACPNVGCGTAYSITPQHLNRQFACRGCGAVLVARADGLHIAGPAPAAASQAGAGTAYAAEDAAPKRSARVAFSAIAASIPAALWTLLFGAGAVLTVFFLFVPLIDRAKVVRKTAQVEAGDLSLKREADAMRKKETSAVKPTAVEQDAFKKRQEDWDKDKPLLQADIEDARIDASKSQYWYMWGMMLGFLALAISSIGFLHPDQTRSRRVVGSIVITAMLLLVFIAFVISSVGVKV